MRELIDCDGGLCTMLLPWRLMLVINEQSTSALAPARSRLPVFYLLAKSTTSTTTSKSALLCGPHFRTPQHAIKSLPIRFFFLLTSFLSPLAPRSRSFFHNMPASTPRIRPYKDFLTPALHRRFARATVTLMGLCYLEAVYIGEWNSCKAPGSSCEAFV